MKFADQKSIEEKGQQGIVVDQEFLNNRKSQVVNEKKANYHSIFEQASDAIFVTDFNGNFIDLNDSLCRMFGYDKETLLQFNISRLLDSEHLQQHPIAFDRIAEGHHIFNKRLMVKSDGEILEVEANVKKFGEDMILVIVRDVTELSKAQKMVQLSEARFRSAFEHSAIGMAIVATNGDWLKVNNELCNIVGYTEAELLACTFQQITHPDDLEKDLEYLQQALAGEIEFYRMEKRYIHKSGQLIWINLSVSLIKDNQSKPLYFVSQIENITERKRSEEAHRKSEANLKAIFDTTDTAYIMVDNVLDIISYNKYAADFMINEIGIPIRSGDSLSNYFLEQKRPFIESKIPEVLTGQHVSYESAYPQPDGTMHWYFVRVYPVSSAEKEVFGMMLAIDNITKRKHDELQKDLSAKLIVSRNKDLEEFAHILSHNVRSHVARLMGLTNLLVEFDINDDEKADVINGISLSANELDDVVRNLNNIVKFKNEINAN